MTLQDREFNYSIFQSYYGVPSQLNKAIEEMAELTLGITASSIMTDCEKFGMCYGCRENCPQLMRGECEIYQSVDEFLEEECE